MLETAQERVILLKTGLSEREIEKLYIEYNHFKINRTLILYEAYEFKIPCSIFQNNRKTRSISLLGIGILVLALFVPIFTLFIALVLVLFIPPIFALAVILNEGRSLISREFKRQAVLVRKPIVISI